MFLYPNDARRDIGLRCAIRDSYAGWTYVCFYSYVRMVSVVTSVRGAQFVKVTLACLMTVLPELITACELVLKKTSFVSWFQLVARDWQAPCLNRCLTNHYTGAGHVRFSCLLKLFRPPRDLNVRPLISLYSYIRMTPVVTSVCGAQFTTVTLVGLMSALILMSEWCPL